MSKAIRFTDKNFDVEVLSSETPVLVDFWGSWCPPCKMVEPIVETLAEELEGQVKVGKVNIDQNSALRSRYEVSAAPTFILFDQGKAIKRVIGAHSKKQLIAMIDGSLATSAAWPIKEITSTTQRTKAPVEILLDKD